MNNRLSTALAVTFFAFSAIASAQESGGDARAEDRARHGEHADGGHAGSGGVRQGARNLGHSIHQGVRETGHAIHQGLRRTGHAIHEGVKATGHAIHHGVDKLAGK